MSNNENKKLTREFGLSSFAIDNRTSVFILMFIIVIMGLSAYNSMPKENFPEIVIPTIIVSTPHPGNSPIDIENLITRPIEKEINSVSGVTEISSTSIQDYSQIVVEFGFDVDPQEALLDVKDAVDKAKADLPSDLDREPNVLAVDFSEIPIVNINISGDNYNLDDLEFYAEALKDQIENLSEISKVEIRGVQDKEVSITLDRDKMSAMQISFRDVEEAIGYENVNISGGDLNINQFRRTVRVSGEFNSVNEIGDIIIKSEFQHPIFLRDIADVHFGYAETKSYSRINGSNVITLEVKKRSGENLIFAVDKIDKIVNDARKKFPEDLEIKVTNDTSRITKMNVENLENNIISGVILVVLVLLFFLGLRNAAFVGIAIPLSMLLGIAVLNIAGVTLNLMVLFSLVMALGMLVDNGIVVVENIYRLMDEEGLDPIRAAKEGVGEVAWPIISSTATTLAAFLPLLFWNDIMGEFMKYLPITLIITLSASLFVALVINPVLTAVFMKVQGKDADKDKNKSRKKRVLIISSIVLGIGILLSIFTVSWTIFGRTFEFDMIVGKKSIFPIVGHLMILFSLLALINTFIFEPLAQKFQDTFLVWLENFYEKTIQWALRGINPYLVVVGMVFLFVASLMLFKMRNPNFISFPAADPNYINVFIEYPTGTDIEKTNATTLKIEKELRNYLKQYQGEGKMNVEAFLANVGEGTSDPNASSGMMGGSATPNKARINISFYEFQKRNLGEVDGQARTTADIMNDVRNIIKKYPGVKITVDQDPHGPSVGPPVSIEISGDDFNVLVKLSEQIKAEIAKDGVGGIEDLKSDLDHGKPELIIDIDREAARRYGLSTAQIAGSMRTALFGKEVSKYKEGEDDYPIMIRLSDTYRHNIDALMNQKISFRDMASGKVLNIPVSSVAKVRYSSTYGAVNRKDLKRVVTLYSNLMEGYNAERVIQEIDKSLKDFKLPEGYTIKYTGEVEKQNESMAFLSRAFLIAFMLIFLIIITQFNSITSPIIIMLSVVFSTIGVFLGVAIFNMDFVVIMTGIGIISLAGVVVNNAIVLIDYTNLTRERRRIELGKPDERLSREEIVDSLVQAGKTRLRPVLLTAITTVLGLIPLAIGLNINFITLISNFDPQFYMGGDNKVFWGPLSWTVIHGLTFATFLTLVFVPVLYLLFDRLGYQFSKLFKK